MGSVPTRLILITMDIDYIDFISYLTIKRGLSRNTINHFKVRIPVVQKFLVENDLFLSKESVEKFLYHLKEQGRSNACLNTYILLLQNIQKYKKDRGYDCTFMDTIKCLPKKNISDIHILSLTEVERLLNTEIPYGKFRGIDHTDYLNFMHLTFTMALAYTGARFSEMAQITVKDFDTANGKVTFLDTKNKQMRRVDIPEPLLSRMKQLIQGKQANQHVFVNTTGHTLHSTDFNNDLKKRAHAAGIDSKRIYPHLLRHTFATHLLMYGSNVDISMVATILGHKDIQQTYSTYLHLADESIRKCHFSHPLIRKNRSPKEIIENVTDTIDKFKLDDDDRVCFTKTVGNNSLTFSLHIK